MNLKRRQALQVGMAGTAALLIASKTSPALAAEDGARAPRAAENDDRHDFDFFEGIWNVRHRRLKAFFAGDGRVGILEPTARDRWKNGRCMLLSDDSFAGRPIKLRQIYSRLPNRNPHWEKAMSFDGGATWETNWHMDYSRA